MLGCLVTRLGAQQPYHAPPASTGSPGRRRPGFFFGRWPA